MLLLRQPLRPRRPGLPEIRPVQREPPAPVSSGSGVSLVHVETVRKRVGRVSRVFRLANPARNGLEPDQRDLGVFLGADAGRPGLIHQGLSLYR